MKKAILLLSASVCFGAAVYFTPKELTELKSRPSASSETVLLVKIGALLSFKSTVTDSAGVEWYLVRSREDGADGFAPSASLEVVGDEKEEGLYLNKAASENEERKRRLAEVRKHDDWSMRIKKAVRNGSICLKMTEEQLVASWQAPYQKTSGFVLGNGDVQIFFYRERNPIAVVLKNGEVVGWSEKE